MPREITGTLSTADGTAVTDTTIYFKPLVVNAYTTSGDLISISPVTVETDSGGAFAVTLFTEEDMSTTGSEFILDSFGYRIEIPALRSARTVSIPDGTASMSWHLLEELE